MDRSTILAFHIVGFFVTLASLPVLFLGLSRGLDEDDVRAAFKEFQQAIKAGDADKIWPLLDKTSQETVEKAAKSLRDGYDKADAKKKAELEKAFGLSADEMAKLTGKVYTKSKRYLGKYNEVPGSKVEKVTVSGEKATIFYVEEDGDKVEMAASRQDGKWKLSPK